MLALLAGANVLLSNAAAQSTCYDTWGREDTNQQPCSAPGTDASATTWCCNKGDSCLSNGLCLSPGSNNLMTQQGCTDKDWGGSCNKLCPASNDQKLTAIPLIPCPTSFDSATNAIKFCCGPDPSACCANTSAWITLPAGTIIPSQDTTTSSSSSTSESNTNSSSLKIGLGIGLGIGIPILLVLLAVAYLLAGQPLHSRHRRRQQQRGKRKQGGGGGGGTNTEKTSDTSHTYPPPRWFGQRRKSFGHVDTNTNVRPSTDDDDGGHGGGPRWPGVGEGAHAWPPRVVVAGHGGPGAASTNNVARAMAQWARSPFGFGGMEPPPPSPKEMDGSSSCGGRRGRVRRETPSRLGAAELPSPDMNSGEWEGRGRGWKAGRRVHVAAEEVELPTPDTPERDVERGLGR
ncbi:hypothetical protein C8A01DRAFT_39881 [Parachaetomium inaequale]|uniref:Uncharacterized protein n=1 Tax=Parachaetomium inaequale TaxID=2588326 RepID=A0AAN6P8D2_9PEZI|nr:hypothetical protein C8A01DRAFT_39881 [Parachaetomium inaequale]